MNRKLWKTVLAILKMLPVLSVNILECIDIHSSGIWFEIWITPVLVFLVYFHASVLPRYGQYI